MLSICATIKNRYYNNFCGLESLPLYNSLFSLHLNQRYIIENFGQFEIIISDFGSTDYDLTRLNKTYPINRLNLKIVNTGSPDFSRGQGLNVAYSASSGDVILFTDIDMVVENGEITFSKFKEVIDSGKSYFPFIHKRNAENNGGVWTQNGCGICVVTRDIISKTNMFIDKRTYGGEDIMFMNECRKHSEIVRDHLHGYIHYPHSRIPWKDV